LYNWTVAAQNFESKLGSESSMGFITVLPGAFSAYRWSTLSPPELDPSSAQGPIVPYFKSVTHGGEMNAFYGKMSLAEDRVLLCGVCLLALRFQRDELRGRRSGCHGRVRQHGRADYCLNGSFFAQV
jgi:hypothetical protein